MKSTAFLEAPHGAARHWYVRTMSLDDIPQVQHIEREAFPTMKPPTSFRRELSNKLASYLVVCQQDDDSEDEEVLGYAGVWFIIDEAHLISIAVAEAYRRQGLGQALLLVALERAREREVVFMTLEVRASNKEAQAMYEKFGFRGVGLRRGYYSDSREDALLMTVDGIQETEYKARLASLRATLFRA